MRDGKRAMSFFTAYQDRPRDDLYARMPGLPQGAARHPGRVNRAHAPETRDTAAIAGHRVCPKWSF